MIENYTQSVHIYVPIALIIIGLLSVLIDFISKSQSFKKASFYLLIIATVGLTIFYISGNNESDLRNQNEITASSQYTKNDMRLSLINLNNKVRHNAKSGKIIAHFKNTAYVSKATKDHTYLALFSEPKTRDEFIIVNNHKVVLVRMVELLPIIDPEIMMNSTTENQGEFIHSVSL